MQTVQILSVTSSQISLVRFSYPVVSQPYTVFHSHWREPQTIPWKYTCFQFFGPVWSQRCRQSCAWTRSGPGLWSGGTPAAGRQPYFMGYRCEYRVVVQPVLNLKDLCVYKHTLAPSKPQKNVSVHWREEGTIKSSVRPFSHHFIIDPSLGMYQ